MAFSTYKSTQAVVKDFQISYTEATFVVENSVTVNNYFQADLIGFIRDGVATNSEAAICENLIAPILKEVWKSYKDKFLLWSHEALRYNDLLTGTPDYILAKHSPLGKIVLDQPYLLIVEAKQDKFEEGWGQCLAAMIAAQKLNAHQEQVIFGIVTNGEVWEFGKLDLNQFTKNITIYLFQDLEPLMAAVNNVFWQCERQLAVIEPCEQ